MDGNPKRSNNSDENKETETKVFFQHIVNESK